jgi:hypothetical protein
MKQYGLILFFTLISAIYRCETFGKFRVPYLHKKKFFSLGFYIKNILVYPSPHTRDLG